MTPRGALTGALTFWLTLIVVTACSSGGNTSSAIDSSVQAHLRHDLATLADAVAAHNIAAAQAALTALDTDAAAAHTAGKLSDAKLNQIRAAEAALQADLTSSSPATPTNTTPTSTTPTNTTPTNTQSPTPTNGKSKGKGDGKSKGKGRGD